jgi:nitric oxide synthase oxygenase domain/subunit
MKKLIAEKMGLDVKSNFSLWRDKALIELNYAILYSFQVKAFL